MPTLEQVKDAISTQCLRRRGKVHAVGIRIGSQVIVVRVTGKLDHRLGEAIRSRAKPYELGIVESPPAYALRARRHPRRVDWSKVS